HRRHEPTAQKAPSASLGPAHRSPHGSSDCWCGGSQKIHLRRMGGRRKCGAARMKSAGAAGKINVSEAIYHRTKDLFDFEARGAIGAKNKGPLGDVLPPPN